MPSTSELDQVGKREDLSDLIAVADAKATVFTSMVRKGAKPKSTLFEWQVDAYDSAKTDGVVDGKDVDSYEDAAKYRKKLQGRVQKFWRTPRVATLAEKVSDVAGVASEFDNAKAKKLIEIKRDMETVLLSDADSQAEGGGLPYKTRGLGAWISNSAQTDLPVPTEYRTPSASIYNSTVASFNEDSMSALLQSRYDQTGTSDQLVAIVGTDLKRQISNMTRYDVDKSGYGHVRMFENYTSEATIFNKVDIYDGDFGRLDILLSSFLPNTKRGYVIDMNMVELRPHTLPNFRELEDRGGGPNGLIEAIIGLALGNPLGQAKIVGS